MTRYRSISEGKKKKQGEKCRKTKKRLNCTWNIGKHKCLT